MGGSPVITAIGIVVGIVFLAVMCYKGHSVFLIAPISALIITIFAGIDLTEGFISIYAAGCGSIFGSLIMMIMTCCAFSHLMVKTKCAYSVANWFIDHLGPKYTPLIITYSAAVLSMGGMMVGAPITAGTIGMIMCRRSGYSKDIVLGCVITGAWTYAYALPFMPSMPNVYANTYLGTTSTTSGTLIGLISNAVMLVGTSLVLQKVAEKWKNGGRIFDAANETVVTDELDDVPPAWKGFAPIILVLVLYNVAKLSLPFSMIISGLFVMVTNLKSFAPGEWFKNWEDGMLSGLIPVASTSVISGLGTLIGRTNLFEAFLGWCETTTMHPAIITFIVVTFMGSCLASSSSALGTSLPTMGPVIQGLCASSGASLGSVSRVATMSSIAPSILPHDGTLVAMCRVYDTTYKKSYGLLFFAGFLVPLLSTILCLVLAVIGL